MLHRILQNFVSNALRYTKRGKVLVGCRLNGESVRIEVWDTGVGIDPAEHESIFEEFYRISVADDGANHRLGLGLAIVSRIVRVLGHDIGLRSQPGEGSLFWIELPVVGRKRVRETRKDARQSGHDRLLLDSAVAVIEDEYNVLQTFNLRLRRWGCTTLIAQSVDELIERVKEAPQTPDIIVADYHLESKHTGLDAIREVRRLAGFEIPAIVVTADHSPSTYQRVLLANCQPMTKPVNPAKLRSLMSSMINSAERSIKS